MIRNILKLQLGFVVVGVFGIGFSREFLPQVSFLAGSAMATLQLVSMIWSWQRILSKKSIALAGTVIVFKYAILGILIFRLLSRNAVEPLWFILGLGTMVPSVGIGGILEMKSMSTGSAEVSKVDGTF